MLFECLDFLLGDEVTLQAGRDQLVLGTWREGENLHSHWAFVVKNVQVRLDTAVCDVLVKERECSEELRLCTVFQRLL